MLGPLITRGRAALLLLAFVVGLAGQAASTAAMASQMQEPMQPGIAAAHVCPGCGMDAQHGAMAPNCMAGAACWNIPGLPAQSTAFPVRSVAIFTASPERVIGGLMSAPDPYPPRSILHA